MLAEIGQSFYIAFSAYYLMLLPQKSDRQERFLRQGQAGNVSLSLSLG